VFALNEETQEVVEIWKCNVMPEESELNYRFTQFALNLNLLTSDLAKSLPGTDSRLRPDQRALENGDLKLAEEEKQRVEAKQRENKEKLRAKFFRESEHGKTGQGYFEMSLDYWEHKHNVEYCDLF
jgi:hypothetical protein